MGWISDLLKEIPLSAVLREKLVLVEERLKELEEENTRLSAENERLHQLHDAHAAPALSEAEVNILKLLAQNPRFIDERQIGAALGLSTTKADYYVTKLDRAGYLRTPMVVVDGDFTYQLSQQGREYLISNNLIE